MIPDDTKKLVDYPLDYDEVFISKNHEKHDLGSTIPICFFEDFSEFSYKKRVYKKSSCNFFQPVFTDLGMCHSFNPTPVTNLLKPSHFTKAFYNAFQNDLILDGILHNGTESGDTFKFLLQGNQRLRHTSHGKGRLGADLRPSTFHFGLSSSNEYFNLQGSSKVIPAGHRIRWNVQVMEIVPTESMKDISINSRKCRFPDENEELTIFKTYSKPACEFEYRLEKTQSICKCVPWDIPWASQSRYPICDTYGNFCFKKIWKKYLKSVKKCLPGCYQLKFISSEVQEKLDADFLCGNMGGHNAFSNIATITYGLGGMKLFNRIQKLKEWTLNGNPKNESYNGDDKKMEYCKDMIKNDLAEVVVMFERPEFIRTSTSKRVSFPDQLGVFGKIFI